MEYPDRLTSVTADKLAPVLGRLTADISTGPRLVAVLLAQWALETGHGLMCRNYNLGNAKATAKWIAAGGDFAYFSQAPPHAKAPVSERMTRRQADYNMALAEQRPNGAGLNMEIEPGDEASLMCWFWARHIQTRFRAFADLESGGGSWIKLLAGKYREALAPASRGDVGGYCAALKRIGPYFLEDVWRYTAVVEQLYRKYLPIARAHAHTVPQNVNPYKTHASDIGIHAAGWVRLSSGVEITALPLTDTGGRGPQFCRSSETARQWLEARGMRLASTAALREFHDLCGAAGPGVHIAPVIYPSAEQIKAAGGDFSKRGIDRLRSANMASQDWCTSHDREVLRRLAAIDWDGLTAADNVGKHIDEWGNIIGWERRDGDPEHQWWQPLSAAHVGHDQLDYATLVHAERNPNGQVRELSPPPPGAPSAAVRAWQLHLIEFFEARGEHALPLYGADGDAGTARGETAAWSARWVLLTASPDEDTIDDDEAPWLDGLGDPATLTLAERCLLWTGYQLGLGVREIAGAEHDPRIVAYSEHCRRGGELLGIDSDGLPIWKGGNPLRLQTDEEPWCAATVSAALVACLLPGESAPHGARVSVAELVADARKAGTLRPLDWEPTPGSLAIEARAGQSPLWGGKGHVRRVVRVLGAEYYGVGGNESNTMGKSWHHRNGDLQSDGHKLVGWIEV